MLNISTYPVELQAKKFKFNQWVPEMESPKKKTGQLKKPANNENAFKDANGVVWITEFIHWRSKKLIKASDYGLKAFPIKAGRK